MTLVSGIVVQQILWWLVFFVVLPIGIQVDDKPQRGFATSAPREFNLRRKLVITTVISTVLWGVVYIVMINGWIDLRDC